MTTPTPEPPAKRRSGLRRWLRTGMVLVAVALGGVAVASQWSGFSGARLLNPLIRLAFKLIRKQPPDEPLTLRGIATWGHRPQRGAAVGRGVRALMDRRSSC
ncbi:MAG: hypothetical protein GEV28_21445 [Actinophytocola sp.]|uniref:hypothetical protein n=1 Tax=Actinophytocola sp. TaxID=1872138 RepID=UPI00132685D5|nr:hypothetical protein [Actinophytocola sp.]MPZ82823.1 hypothetical protein [Actinophytocola sp.]